MQISKWVAVTLTVCLFGVRAYAQNVDDIIAKNLDAMGGKAKLATLNSVYEETNSSMMDNDFPGKVWIANNTAYRMEMDIMGAKMIITVNKDKGWAVIPMSGNNDAQDLPDDAIKAFAPRMNLAGPFYNYKDRGYTATLLGKDSVAGKDTYKIKLSKTGEPDGIFYVDAATYYIDKASVAMYMNGQTNQADIVYTSYEKTPDGYIYPVGYFLDLPQGKFTTTVTKFTVNQPVDSTLFKKP